MHKYMLKKDGIDRNKGREERDTERERDGQTDTFF